MVYLKATTAGIVGAVLFAVVWLVASIVLPMLWQMWVQRGRGSGGIGAVSVGSGSTLLAALVGFVVSFVWIVRHR